MKIIPTVPKKSKLMSWLKQLPISLQLILIISLFYLTWHFRYFVSGVNESELVKVESILYSIECKIKFQGRIVLFCIHPFLNERYGLVVGKSAKIYLEH